MSAEELKSRMLTRREVAKVVGVAVSNLPRLIRTGMIPAPITDMGKRWLWPEAAIDAWFVQRAATSMANVGGAK